jgi:2'-5' RNA ligase
LPSEEGATLDVWLLVPSEPVKAAAQGIQRAFAHLDWLEPAPPHFLHVTIGHDGPASFAGIEPFEIAFRRVNCFAEAVVVEVEGGGPRHLAERIRDTEYFLPHLSLAYVRRGHSPDELRETLQGLRDMELGQQRVDEAILCRVPIARATILQPWTVLGREQLRR